MIVVPRFGKIVFVMLLICNPLWGMADTVVKPSLDALFHKAGVEGALVVLDLEQDRLILSDEVRCQSRFIPASTFKMLNALIALETGVVDVEEVFPWDGQPQSYPAWEKNMTLKEAMQVSAVPVFQVIARRIGLERMRTLVRKVGFGNNDIGDTVDRFWLDGPLTISAIEEARFVASLTQSKLPFQKHTQKIVQDLIPTDTVGKFRVHGKTGWATKTMTGWYTGWLERPGYPVIAFSLNMTMRSIEEAPLRKKLVLEALRSLNSLDENSP